MKQILLLIVPGIWIGVFAAMFAQLHVCALNSRNSGGLGINWRASTIERNRKWRRHGPATRMRTILEPMGIDLIVKKGRTRQKRP
jgi:hypothetical protein